jgi:hypothetical protein
VTVAAESVVSRTRFSFGFSVLSFGMGDATARFKAIAGSSVAWPLQHARNNPT